MGLPHRGPDAPRDDRAPARRPRRRRSSTRRNRRTGKPAPPFPERRRRPRRRDRRPSLDARPVIGCSRCSRCRRGRRSAAGSRRVITVRHPPRPTALPARGLGPDGELRLQLHRGLSLCAVSEPPRLRVRPGTKLRRRLASQPSELSGADVRLDPRHPRRRRAELPSHLGEQPLRSTRRRLAPRSTSRCRARATR